MTSRHFAQIKPDGVKRAMPSAMVSEIFQDAVYRADNAALPSNIPRCTWVTDGIFGCNDNGVADFEFAMH